MSEYREIRYEVDEHVATITFNRPDQRNPISVEMLDEVGRAVRASQEDNDVRVLVITGAGRAFCSGGDVKSMAQVATSGGAAVAARQEQVGLIQETQLLLRRFPKVLIAAVNGAAYGAGLDLACSADFRLAADTARFCEVYVRLGLAPGGGGAWLLPRIVGLTNALDLILSGEPIDAQTALAIGLVSRVARAEGLPGVSSEFAPGFALSAPRGVQVAKRAVRHGLDMSFEAALDYIRPQIGMLRQTEDHQEGLRALQERRPPRFQGK